MRLDRFLASHPLAGVFRHGALAAPGPACVSAAHGAGLPKLVAEEQPIGDDEPVAVLTYGPPQAASRRPRSLRMSAALPRAEVARRPGARVRYGPHPATRALVSTFSLWRDAAAMRAFAHRGARAHRPRLSAVRAPRLFHSESIFHPLFAPTAAAGDWSELPRGRVCAAFRRADRGRRAPSAPRATFMLPGSECRRGPGVFRSRDGRE